MPLAWYHRSFGRFWQLLLGAALLVGVAQSVGAKPEPPSFQSELKWQPLFQGVVYSEVSAKMPRPMRGHAVRLDLTAPGIEFLATPPVADKPNQVASLKTSSFLLKHGCQVAINGAPFSPVVKEEGKAQQIMGLHVSRGQVVSKGNDRYDALLLSKNNKAWLAAPPFELKEVHNAVGGFQIVLKKGVVPEKLPDYNSGGPVHPRSGAGISADGRYLFLLAIDGRQMDYSMGATIQEVGAWLKGLGAAEGINLDGGGTTTLVIAAGAGRAKVLNRPIHGNAPSTERPAGSHLGVFARPLEKD